MKGFLGVMRLVSLLGLGLLGFVFTNSAIARTDGDIITKDRELIVGARLDGYQEVPAVSTTGIGAFKARVIRSGKAIEYALAYSNIEGDVTQAHIHFGRTGTNGGIIVFLCQTGTNQDPTSQAPLCPSQGSVEGIITEDNIIGPAGQGIEAGSFRELVGAIRARAAYVNVHSTKFPTGEIRGNVGTNQQVGDGEK